MATDIGVKATGDRRAIERIAAKRHTTAAAVVKKERARMRRLFGRGALYRADIMGSGADEFAVARYNARKGATMANHKAKTEKKVRCSFDITESEAQKLCELRCEPKPSTAAAQVVRIAIKKVAK